MGRLVLLSGPRKRIALAALAAAAVVAGAAYATIPDGDGTIHGCYANKGGALRVVDLSTNESCRPFETPIEWNEQGPEGDRGEPGPPGPAGALANIDDLDGIPCTGVNSKRATVRVDYGTGIEAPLSLVCVTHLVGNPGAFTVRVTAGTLSLPFFGELELPTNGWQFAGEIDIGGKITAPGSAFQLSDIPLDSSNDAAGFTSVHVTGAISFASTGVTGSLVPEGGATSLTGGLHASVAFTATATILGQPTLLYSGTCAFGSAATPIPVSLTSDPPGAPYSQATGVVTLSSGFSAPSLDGCSPAMPSLYVFLLGLFSGDGRLTLTGTTDPTLTAPP